MLGPGNAVSLCDLSESVQIASKLNIPPQTDVLSVKWVKFNGTEYRSGLIICGEVDIDLPVFYKIQDIVVRNEFVLLVAMQLKTVCFYDHLYAYRIDPKCTDSLKVFNATELMYYKPYDLQMSYGSDIYFGLLSHTAVLSKCDCHRWFYCKMYDFMCFINDFIYVQYYECDKLTCTHGMF